MFTQYRLLFASVIYLLCGLLLFNGYRFIFDDDGIGYMMVARRLAAGDWHNAINGYWSPLHSWLVVPLLKTGMTEMTAFKLSNWLIGLLLLCWVHRLSNKVDLRPTLKTTLLLVSIPVIIYFVVIQIAADVLFCLMVLIYIDLLTQKDFFKKPLLNIAAGALAAMMYFSKTYGFPFFLLHFTVMQVWFCYTAKQPGSLKRMISNMVLAFGTFFLLCSPWLWLLYEKYHLLTFGYSGKFNLDVHLYDRYITSNEIAYPPPYPDSPGYWEDPINIPMKRAEGQHYFSFDIMIRQIRLFLTNVTRGIKSFNALSYLTLAVFGALGIYLVQHKNKVLSVFLITALLLPLGYLLVFIESRYIWPLGFLGMIAGAFLLQEYFAGTRMAAKWALLFWTIFFSSFLIHPIDALKDGYNQHAELFKLADYAKKNRINGKYLVHANGKRNYGAVLRLAFLTHNSMYFRLEPNASDEEVLKSLHRNGIGYYFFIYDLESEKKDFQKSALYQAASKVYEPGIYNMMILEIN